MKVLRRLSGTQVSVALRLSLQVRDEISQHRDFIERNYGFCSLSILGPFWSELVKNSLPRAWEVFKKLPGCLGIDFDQISVQTEPRGAISDPK